jgi:hypothetical protein
MSITKPPSKEEIRRQLDAQVEAFLRQGGEVKQVPRGVSGQYGAEGPMQMRQASEGPRSERTYVPEVVAAIEERRQELQQKGRRASTPRPRKPRRKLIYDDFGEPLRWQWEE